MLNHYRRAFASLTFACPVPLTGAVITHASIQQKIPRGPFCTADYQVKVSAAYLVQMVMAAGYSAQKATVAAQRLVDRLVVEYS